MNKRGAGEGSISQRKDGTWWARVTVGQDENGKQIRKAFYGKTRKAVQDKLAATQNEINQGIYIATSTMPFGNWMQHWLENHKRAAIKPTSYKRYSNMVKKNILPALAHYPLNRLKPFLIQQFINTLDSDGLSGASLELAHILIKMSLDQAVKEELLRSNPADDVIVPKKPGKKGRSLTLDEQEKFIKTAKGFLHGNVFILMLGTGLRLGETLALTWNDIDFESKTLVVNKTLHIINDESTGGVPVRREAVPKTQSSNRTVPLLPALVQMLLEQKAVQDGSNTLSRTLLVFCTQKGRVLSCDSMWKSFKIIARESGISSQYSPHSLRHTFATRGLENGISLRTMQELMGHSSIEITGNLYSHVLQETKHDFIQLIANTIQPE